MLQDFPLHVLVHFPFSCTSCALCKLLFSLPEFRHFVVSELFFVGIFLVVEFVEGFSCLCFCVFLC